jgi:hypothetical protein
MNINLVGEHWDAPVSRSLSRAAIGEVHAAAAVLGARKDLPEACS